MLMALNALEINFKRCKLITGFPTELFPKELELFPTELDLFPTELDLFPTELELFPTELFPTELELFPTELFPTELELFPTELFPTELFPKELELFPHGVVSPRSWSYFPRSCFHGVGVVSHRVVSHGVVCIVGLLLQDEISRFY